MTREVVGRSILLMEIMRFNGDRAELLPLFELAESSHAQLASYLELGTIFVARDGDRLVGHVQLIDRDAPGEAEIKNMAVAETHQGQGIGRALVEHAAHAARAAGCARLVVATAAADTGNLRFYQRVGFRMCGITRDAFVPATGYPEPVVFDGIELRDQVWFDRAL